jgi:hypothetical protein
MKLRHRLLRFLSFGDMVILNVDLANDGTIRSRNAGSMLVAGLKVWQWDRYCALSIGRSNPDAMMHFETYGEQSLTIQDCRFDGRKPEPERATE